MAMQQSIINITKNILLRLLNSFMGKYFYSLLSPLFRKRIFTIKYGLAKGLKIRGRTGLISRFLGYEDVAGEKFLMNLSFKGKTVYDVEAHIGTYTLFFARAAGEEGRIFAFEPNPDNYRCILDNIRINNFNNIFLRQIAIGKTRGRVNLSVPVFDTSSSSISVEIKKDLFPNNKIKTFEVWIDSLDNIVTADEKPDFIKIDVEGLELEVLEGAEKILKLYKPELFIEIHGANIKKWVNNARKIVGFVRNLGYTVYSVELGRTITASSPFEEIKNCGPIYCF